MRFWKIALVAVAALSFGVRAEGIPTTWTPGTQSLGSSVVTSLGTLYPREFTGVNSDPSGSFAAFCVEPKQLYDTVTGHASLLTGPRASVLSQLFTGADWRSWDRANDGVTDRDQVKALQVGVWEIMSGDLETVSGFDLSAGSFSIATDPNWTIVAGLISQWIDNGNDSLVGSIYRLSDNSEQRLGSQDLIIAVPEPSTYALMVAGLAAVGFVARRRKT